ncbi:ribonuclease H, partial [Trifolium pratense]
VDFERAYDTVNWNFLEYMMRRMGFAQRAETRGSVISLFFLIVAEDDTVLVGEGKWENLWSLKTVLRSFELVSGLKVNFYKRIPVGANPKRKVTWNPIVEAMKKRLNT